MLTAFRIFHPFRAIYFLIQNQVSHWNSLSTVVTMVILAFKWTRSMCIWMCVCVCMVCVCVCVCVCERERERKRVLALIPNFVSNVIYMPSVQTILFCCFCYCVLPWNLVEAIFLFTLYNCINCILNGSNCINCICIHIFYFMETIWLYTICTLWYYCLTEIKH